MWPWAAPGSWIPTTSPYYVPRQEGEEMPRARKQTCRNKGPLYCLLLLLALLIVTGSILTPVLLLVRNNGESDG